MSAVFVKYCALCGEENLALASFCERCDADLMNVAVEMRREKDAVSPPVAHAASSQSEASDKKHEENEIATRRVAQAPNSALELESVANPSLCFRVQAGQSVGRSARADVVLAGAPDLEYISRAHARFLQRRRQWYVQYIAEGNSITVDGVQSTNDSELAIYDGSIVVFSFTAFRVKLP